MLLCVFALSRFRLVWVFCRESVFLSQLYPYTPGMKKAAEAKPVERLFPFVLRSRILIPGRENLARSKSRLHFVLITHDLSENSRAEILKHFSHYPVVQHYCSEDLEKFFGVKGAKVVGFAKSGLAQSLYAELKQHRLNQPVSPKPEAQTPTSPDQHPSCPGSG